MAGLYDGPSNEDPRFVDESSKNAARAEQAKNDAVAAAAQASNDAAQALGAASSVNTQYQAIMVIQQDVTNKQQEVAGNTATVSNAVQRVSQIQADINASKVHVDSQVAVVNQLKADTDGIKSDTNNLKTAAEAAKTASQQSSVQSGTYAQNSATSATQAAGSAVLAQSWAVKMDGPVEGGMYSAKYWAEQAKVSIAGVQSFNGRVGRVVPMSGDYTASMVGAFSIADNTLWRDRGFIQDLSAATSVLPGYFVLSPDTVSSPEATYGHGIVIGPGRAAGQNTWATHMVFTHTDKVYFRNAVNTAPSGSWPRFYTTADKPTPSELGAVAQAVMDAMFPVGHMIITLNPANPSTYGYKGTWAKVEDDTTLITASSNIGTVSGTNNPAVPLPAHSHTVSVSGTTGGGGGHNHSGIDPYCGTGANNPYRQSSTAGGGMGPLTSWAGDHTHPFSASGSTSSAGSSSPTLDVRGKRINVYVWQRTA